MHDEKKIEEKVFIALGETTALFMSSEEKGINIIMPSEQLRVIGDRLVLEMKQYAESVASHIQKQTEKAFGGCTKCYGKGYSTVDRTLVGYPDFIGDKGFKEKANPIITCACDRGKQIAEIIRPLNDLE